MKKHIISSVAVGALCVLLSVCAALLRPWPTADAVPEPSALSEVAAETATPAPTPQREVVHDTSLLRVLDDGVVLEMTMYDYLTGAIAAEMPASFEPAALAAQAVAARTYALYKMQVSPSVKHADADVCTDIRDCAAFSHDSELRERWGDDYDASIAKIRAAVSETDGIILTHDDAPILAAFHSSSRGFTAAAERVWHSALPYLVSVPTPETPEDTPRLVSSVTLTIAEFKSAVASAFPAARLGDDATQWVTDLALDDTGRVSTLKIGGFAVEGTALRAAFGLRSAAIEISVADEVTFTTYGYGHGVGMSQYGANAMAQSGATWREILANYYVGAKFSDAAEAAPEKHS